MAERLVVVGGGGFGRETLDVVEALVSVGEPLHLVGVIDSGLRDVDRERLDNRSVAYLGTEADWLSTAVGDERFVVAIGSPGVRAVVADRLTGAGLRATTLIHPRAVIGSQARIGEGVVITSGVQVSTNVAIGDHVHLNPASIIGHDSSLADFVSVNPGAIVSGNVVVEARTLLGAGAVLLQGITVGAGATVGAAACVTKDVAAGTAVVGVPAHVLEKRTSS